MTRLTCPRCQQTAEAVTWPRQAGGGRSDRACPNCGLAVVVGYGVDRQPRISYIQEEIEP